MFRLNLNSFVARGAGACLALASACGVAGASTIVTNGTFEADTPIGANPSNPNVNASQQPSGWTLTSQDANNPHAFVLGGVGVGGSQAVDFNGYDVNPNAILSQSIATVMGTTYNLSFYYGTIGGASFPQSLQAEVVGLGGLDLVNTTVTRPSPAPQALVQSTFSFLANSTATTIRFTDLTTNHTGSVDGVLDNVSVDPVPEPAGVSVLALGGLALVRRSRRR